MLVLRLNRPQALNAITVELSEAAGMALDGAEHDDEIRAVVITGTGDRAFSAAPI